MEGKYGETRCVKTVHKKPFKNLGLSWRNIQVKVKFVNLTKCGRLRLKKKDKHFWKKVAYNIVTLKISTWNAIIYRHIGEFSDSKWNE